MTNDYFRQTRATNGLSVLTPRRRRRRRQSKVAKIFSFSVLIIALAFLGSPWIDKQITNGLDWFDKKMMVNNNDVFYLDNKK